MVKVSIEHTVRRAAICIPHRKRDITCAGELHLVTCKRRTRIDEIEESIANKPSPVIFFITITFIRTIGIEIFLDILIDLECRILRAINRSKRFESHIIEAFRGCRRESCQSLAIAFVLLRGTTFVNRSVLRCGITHDKRMDIRRLHVRTARRANLVALTIIPAEELFARLRNSLEHHSHALRIISRKRRCFSSTFRAHLHTHLIHRRHIVAKFLDYRIRMRAHLFGDNTAKSIRAVHLQMHCISLIGTEITVFRLCSVIENKLRCILLTHRNHVVRHHFAHVDKRHIEFFRKLLIKRRIASVAVVDLRRRIVIQAADWAHDNRISAFRSHITHQLFHIGSKEVFRTVIHIIDAKLNDNIIARFQFIGDAIAIGATALKEHIVIADSGIAFFIFATATKRHAALTAVYDRSFTYVKPVVEILTLTLFRIIPFGPILHSRVTTKINGDLSQRKRSGHHRSHYSTLPNFTK